MRLTRLCALLLGLGVTPLAGEPWTRHVIDDSSNGADGVRLADFNRDGKLDIVTGWEQGGIVRLYLQPDPSAVRSRWPAVTVGPAKSVEDAVAVDLDSDGQLDVVSCCEGRTKTMYVHWAPAAEHLLDPQRWVTEPLPASQAAQSWMFCLPLQVDERHGIDLVVGSKGNQAAVGWWQAPPNPRSLEDWTYHRIVDAGWIMSLIATDLDRDGNAEILFSDRKGPARGVKWLQRDNSTAHATTWTTHVVGATDKEVMFLNVGDLDQDGETDIVATTWNGTLQIFRRRPGPQVQWLHHQLPLPFQLERSKSVVIADLDRDGHPDLATTNRSQPDDGPALALMRYQQSPFAGPWQQTDIGGPDGSKFDLLEAIDLDSDGDLDLVTCEEIANLGVIWYENPTFAP